GAAQGDPRGVCAPVGGAIGQQRAADGHFAGRSSERGFDERLAHPRLVVAQRAVRPRGFGPLAFGFVVPARLRRQRVWPRDTQHIRHFTIPVVGQVWSCEGRTVSLTCYAVGPKGITRVLYPK